VAQMLMRTWLKYSLTFTSGRNSSVIDVWIDFSGVCGGLLAGFLVCILLSLILSSLGLKHKR
ncbi:MAG: hypothetical protein LUD82_05950, partial [Clostridiales bacterium]|nr:hypothetical protein [Clostridiales bacterium]